MAARGSTVFEVAREVVGAVAPAQVGEFDFVARRYADRPTAARRANLPSTETTASILDFGGEVLAAVALGVTTDMCKDMIKSGVRDLHQRSRSRLRRLWPWRREPVVDLDDEVPPIDDEQADALQARAVAAVVGVGVDAAVADAVGKALVKSWPRLPR